MLSEDIKDKLKANWGEKADSLDCLAYVKVSGLDYDSQWACFIYAMNPDDEDDIITLTRDKHDYESTQSWSLQYLFGLYGFNGEYVSIDKEYTPKRVWTTLVKSPWKY